MVRIIFPVRFPAIASRGNYLLLKEALSFEVQVVDISAANHGTLSATLLNEGDDTPVFKDVADSATVIVGERSTWGSAYNSSSVVTIQFNCIAPGTALRRYRLLIQMHDPTTDRATVAAATSR
jgi:hypothetical protein